MKDFQELNKAVIDAWRELVRLNGIHNHTMESALAFEAADLRWHDALARLREFSYRLP